ncbi:MAG: sugar kinase [Acidimicrobiia bacterium]|nr:sugar kinase [Acidimicrobiia bacterium]MDH5503563.1 sugar kinase [Acidimicrobiia bacterium]
MVGDTNVDLEIRLPSGGVAPHANPDPRLFGGGSAANTAAALARLGESCSFVGTVGDDSYGRFAVQSLADAGVDTQWTGIASSQPTVMVVTVLTPDANRLIYVWPPRGGAHAELQSTPIVEALNGAAWLHVSGICLRVSPAREAILDGMEQARSNGISVSLDLNLRLENWGWDGEFRHTIMAAVERSNVVMGDAKSEVVPLVGNQNPVEAATHLAGDDRIVVARMGADGAVACSKTAAVVAPGYSVDVVDTVGAGDAFNAGFIASYFRRADTIEALQWGNAVAAVTVSRPGARATPALPEVTRFLATQ